MLNGIFSIILTGLQLVADTPGRTMGQVRGVSLRQGARSANHSLLLFQLATTNFQQQARGIGPDDLFLAGSLGYFKLGQMSESRRDFRQNNEKMLGVREIGFFVDRRTIYNYRSARIDETISYIGVRLRF